MKRVRFQTEDHLREIACILPSRSDSSEELGRRWYSLDEYNAFKESAKVLSIEVRYSGRSHLLRGSIQPVCNEESPFPKEDELQCRLIAWSRVGGLCRGLESWVDSTQGKERRKIKRDSIQVVLEAQKIQSESTSRQLYEETLRQISEQYTASARRYARRMGIADAASCLLDHRKSGEHQGMIQSKVSSDKGNHYLKFVRKAIHCSPMA
jgi:hypothetical protein